MKRILILCTGNSCRSQMAEGLLSSFDASFEVLSAGTKPEKAVNPNAIEVMREIGINISKSYPKPVENYLTENFDFVITVCDNAKESCPVFTGSVEDSFHIGFQDPAAATGTDEEILNQYRMIRDEIKEEFWKFYLYYLQ